jgi:hypothetical protein
MISISRPAQTAISLAGQTDAGTSTPIPERESTKENQSLSRCLVLLHLRQAILRLNILDDPPSALRTMCSRVGKASAFGAKSGLQILLHQQQRNPYLAMSLRS